MKNSLISIFVIAWLVLFHYESTRFFYLEPWLKRSLPHMKFLFPPAGWIMFYQVGDNYGYAQVYGVKDGRPQVIDPHLILQTRPIGYDNIHRNALVSVLSRDAVQPFCKFLRYKFPYFDTFVVTHVNHPHVVERPFERVETLAYECRESVH